ncbi:MAG: nucleotidyltransferase domain-containing protein [Bdellovibrio sp.]
MDFFGLPENTLDKIVTVFKKYPEIEKANIYGSRAKGNFKPGSDIDICIFAPKMDLSLKFKLELELDDLLLPYKIDLTVFHMIENQNLIEHIQRVGKTVYNK